jgi:signal transduction histidine kinase
MRMVPRRALMLDVAVGVLVGASGVPHHLSAPWVVVAGQVAMGLAMAGRRLAPFTAAAAVSAAFLAQAIGAGHPPEDQVALLAFPLVAYAVAAFRTRPVAVAGLLALVAAVCAEIAIVGNGQYAYSTGIVATGWIPGFFMAGKRVEIRRLEDVTRQLGADRDRDLARAAAGERIRLARELHDVVSHTVGAMIIQAAAANLAMAVAPDAARTALDQARQVGMRAAAELDLLLELLPDDGTAQPSATGVLQIPALVDAVRDELVNEIVLTVSGCPRPVGALLDHSVYRIVQESLTNARKHAPGAVVTVLLGWPSGEHAEPCLVIDVEDSGSADRPAGLAVGGVGYGLAGIRERIELLDGDLVTGTTSTGGHRLHATLPLAGAARAGAAPAVLATRSAS